MRCTMFSSTPGFYPVDTSGTLPVLMMKNVSGYCQMSRGEQNCSLVENPWVGSTETVQELLYSLENKQGLN